MSIKTYQITTYLSLARSLTFFLLMILTACGHEITLDLRAQFERIETGDSLTEVRRKLKQPLQTPASITEVLGVQYSEYHLSDAYSNYELEFVGITAMNHEPKLVSKFSRAHDLGMR